MKAYRNAFVVVYAIGCGLLLGEVVGLQPVWWLAWVAPAFLLWLGAHGPPRLRFALVFMAALIATSSLIPALLPVMPWPVALLSVVLLALPWVVLVGETVRLRRSFGDAAWTVMAFPVVAVALDTLMARFLPDGNWNGYAYTQADVLPVAQMASLLGVPGLLFVLMLVPATLFHVAETRLRTRGARVLGVCTALLVVATVVHGTIRLDRAPSPGAREVTFGLAAIDDAIGLQARPPYVAAIRAAYAQRVAGLAGDGAQIVVLPEKIAVVPAAAAQEWEDWFSALARQHGIWLVGSITIAAADGVRNFAWLYAPDGARGASYQKQRLAPVERDYLAGSDFVVRSIDGLDYALAICKDMHFASFARQYGGRGVAAALVPAWDFVVDADLARRMTLMRGIENGFAVVRPSRDGLLSVNDALGRPIALARSGPLPGKSLLASVRLAPGERTAQSRTGDAFGWLCVALALVLAVVARRVPKADPG